MVTNRRTQPNIQKRQYDAKTIKAKSSPCISFAAKNLEFLAVKRHCGINIIKAILSFPCFIIFYRDAHKSLRV
jgi:hypothetical protein